MLVQLLLPLLHCCVGSANFADTDGLSMFLLGRMLCAVRDNAGVMNLMLVGVVVCADDRET